MSLIANFQARFAFVQPDGTLTPEAARMLREWFARIGGSNAIDLTAVISLLAALTISVNDDKIVLAFDPHAAAIADLKNEIAELRQLIAFTPPPAAASGDVYDSIF